MITAQPIHDAVAWLIEQLPPNLHLMIASRTVPPFSLARWRVRRELLEIGAADLRFSAEEATVFYNEVMSLSLSREDVLAIEARTEGWAAALQLSALSLKGGTDAHDLVRALSGEHRLIADYLAEEVLDQQPQDRRRFLLRTSVLDRMCAELCEAVTGEPGAQDQLRALESANLFLIPLDESGRWFRYHHLFADLLRKQLASDGSEDVRALQRRAAEWFAENGRFDEAVRHAMAAGPSEWIEEKIERWGEALIMSGEIELLRGWVRSLPEEMRTRAPYVGVHGAWSAVLSGRPEEVESWACDAERAAGSSPPARVSQHLAAARAYAAQHLGRFEEAVALSEAALTGTLEPEVRAALQLNAGMTLRRLGRYERAVELLEQAAQNGLAIGHIYLVFGAHFHRAASLRVLGRVQAALRTLEELDRIRSRKDRGGYLAISGGEVERAYVHWLLGDEDAALLYANRAMEVFDLGSEPWDLAYSRSLLIRILISAGQYDDASLIIDETRMPSRALERAIVQYVLETVRAELELARGDPKTARKLLQSPADHADPEIAFDRRWIDARIALALGEPVEEIAMRELEAAEREGRLMHASAWAALAAVARRDAPSIDNARKLAERTGIERWRMIFDLSTAKPAQAVRPAKIETPMIESLTQRELEVLGLIAEGLSNQDAASRLFVSVGTVKTHVHKILAKLAAENRTEAVHRARTLGLIR